MKLNLQFESVSSKHVDAALELAMEAYREERGVLPYLPEGEVFVKSVRKSVQELFEKGIGFVALHDGEPVGFFAGWEIPQFWGRDKGIYSPLFGHGAVKRYRQTVYQEMYRHAAEELVKQGIVSHAITHFAQDQETIDTWFWLGFGLRCVDGIRPVEPIQMGQPELEIRKGTAQDIVATAELSRLNTEHLNESPMFMPRREGDAVANMTEWFQQENCHYWIAIQNGQTLGYMKIQPAGENYITTHPTMMNITGAYVHEEARGTNIGKALLATIQDWLQENGYQLCGVDFESFNTEGGRFWTKHFTSYTYSLTRRVDERIMDFVK